MGSCEEAEITEGRERRPPEPVVLTLSPVMPVEVLAEDECLRSVLALGDSLRRLSSLGGSQRDSSLIGEPIMVEWFGISFLAQPIAGNTALKTELEQYKERVCVLLFAK